MAYVSYNSKDVSIIIGGVPIDGSDTEALVDVELKDRFNEEVDSNGNLTRYELNDNSADVKLTLVQSSKSNDLMSNWAQLDAQGGSGSFTIFIKDSGGNTFFSSTAAYVKRPPNITYAEGLTKRVWLIKATNCTSYIGG